MSVISEEKMLFSLLAVLSFSPPAVLLSPLPVLFVRVFFFSRVDFHSHIVGKEGGGRGGGGK